MKIIESSDFNGYVLDSVKCDKSLKKAKDNFKELLDENINALKSRLEEMIELRDTKENIIYLLKDTDSCYNYVDKEGNDYQYSVINGKPVLVSADFKMYVIVGYYDVKNVRKMKHNSRYVTESFVDKACVVKPL